MFKKSRRKIVVFVMTALVLFLFGTFLTIYLSSYIEISNRNQSMLEDYVHKYSLSKPPDDKKPEKKESKSTNDVPPKKDKAPSKTGEIFLYQKIDFYSVAIGDDEEILSVDTANSDIYTEQDIVSVAENIRSENKSHGHIGNIVYMVTDKGDYTLVVFNENTVLFQSISTLVRFTVIYGIVSIIVIFILSVSFSKWIVHPLEENYIKQKQFISDAGHELKTPISVISANAELLARELGENLWLSNIQYENERMGLLIKQLLELSKTEDAVVPMERVNLSRIVLGEALPFESVAFEKNHELKCDIDENLYILGNTSQIKQLTAILLDNAISHSFPEKEITLTVKEKHKIAVISVVNYGHEISKEQKEEIFERFYRMDKVRNSSDNHYGLGLAIARAIVISHKGRLEVRCYDKKVNFSVYLPIN